MLELAQVFDSFWDEYCQNHALPEHTLTCINDLRCCQTSYFGGNLLLCNKCGHEHFCYHSCKSRFCPKCYKKQQDKWLVERRKELLNCLYFHLVLTVPQELHELCKRYPKIVYGILMRESAAAILLLCKDKKYLGANAGIMEVLHTWTRSQLLHPHVHCLVPAGGLTENGDWQKSRESFLIPVKALSDIFRAKVRDALKKEGIFNAVPSRAWKIRWVTYAKPSVQGANKVLEYLARYVFKSSISNSNILNINQLTKEVTFRYCDHKKGWEKMTLSAAQFIARIIQHMLPKGFQKIRYYGFWNSSKKEKMKKIIYLLGPHPDSSKDEDSDKLNLLCPHCHKGQMLFFKSIIRERWRAPP